MASVSLPPDQSVWNARFRVYDARTATWKQKCVTTGLQDRDAAQLIADQYETLAKSLAPDAPRRDSPTELLKRIRSIFDTSGVSWPADELGEGPDFASFAEDWITRREAKNKGATLTKYRIAIEDWKKFIGHAGMIPMGRTTSSEAQRYYDSLLASGLSTGTAKNKISLISSIYQRATDLGHFKRNPVRAVERQEVVNQVRKPFSPEAETKVLDFLRDADATDWLTCSMLGRWAGMRLGDAANLRWVDITKEKGVTIITFSPQKKTRHNGDGKAVIIPALPALAQYLDGLTERAEFLCPSLAGRSTGGKSGLSCQFAEILEAAGVDRQKVERKDDGYDFYAISFHSWRHTLTTRLAEAGVPSEARRLMTDHDDAKIHAKYTHVGAVSLFNQIERASA